MKFQVSSFRFQVSKRAFTLVELLVVISILGLLAALSVPAIKNIGKASVATSASQQLLDDVARARQLAMSRRTTVYMVFVPTNFFNVNFWSALSSMTNASERLTAMNTASNLIQSQLSGYTFIANGQLGDQPGRHEWRYLSEWQALPEGNFIAAQKFARPAGSPGAYFNIPVWEADNFGRLDNAWRSGQSGVYCFSVGSFPFPTESSPHYQLPFIAFNHLGRLVSETLDGENFHHAYIPLAQGIVAFGFDGTTKRPQPTIATVDETPPGNSTNISYNIVDIDPLIGRARLMFYKLQ